MGGKYAEAESQAVPQRASNSEEIDVEGLRLVQLGTYLPPEAGPLRHR